MYNDDKYLQGSDCYEGKCLDCGKSSGTCYDELCDKCLDKAPIKCPKCWNFVMPHEYNHEHQKCNTCVDIAAEEFTENIKNKIETILLAQTINYKPNK